MSLITVCLYVFPTDLLQFNSPFGKLLVTVYVDDVNKSPGIKIAFQVLQHDTTSYANLCSYLLYPFVLANKTRYNEIGDSNVWTIFLFS
jgi:hypothetical protein